MRNISIIVGLILAFAIFAIGSAKVVSGWFDTHQIVFNQVIDVQLNKPVEIQERKVNSQAVIQVVQEIPELEGLTDPTEHYICETFGPYDCKTAIAIARAESRMREDAVNVNTNGTVDLGIFQVNSVHFDREGCSIQELVFARQNVDCAYQIYQEQGWSPWVAFKNGNFRNHIE